MAIARYGVLVGRPIGRKIGQVNSPHYQIHIIDDTVDYRIAINIRSQDGSELEFYVDENFQHPITSQLLGKQPGFFELDSTPTSGALDFIRGNLFDRTQFQPLPAVQPGPDNDLDDKIDKYVQLAIGDEDALIYAFGQRWGPEKNKKDQYFGFLPGNGIHDIHMNQGNPAGAHAGDNGVYQDGGLLIHFPAGGGTSERWVGIFLKFQTQTWHTNDTNGNAIPGDGGGAPSGGGTPSGGRTHPTPPGSGQQAGSGAVRIVAAQVNPAGDDAGKETVTLINASASSIDLTGWAIKDRAKNAQTLSGALASGEAVRISLAAPVQLGNGGGIITLLDANGLKVDGVSYTGAQAAGQGATIVF